MRLRKFRSFGKPRIFKERKEQLGRAHSGAASVHVPLWGFAVPPKDVAGVVPLFLATVRKGSGMKRRIWFVLGPMMAAVLAVGAVKTLVIASKTVTGTSDILEIFYTTRSGLPPLPPPMDYKVIASQLSKDRFDFLSTPNWAFTQNGGTLYLSEKSKLAGRLPLPMHLVAYEDLASGKVVLTGTEVGTKNIQTLAVIDAPEFSPKDVRVSLDKYLMDELGPRRIIWTAVLKPEEDAWTDLLSLQEESLAAPMMMTMSVPETITGFQIVQDGTNLSVNLPDEFAGATVSLKQSTNLVEGVWSTVLQTNVTTTGMVFLAYADIPDFVCETTVSTNWVNCPNHDPMDPDPVCTNQTQVTVTNQVSMGGGLVYYRTSAVSTVDSDGDGLDNVTEHSLGTDYQNADSDGDGMPDGYETAQGLDPLSAADGGSDSDGDGRTNLEEFERGTDPNDSNSTSSGVLVVMPGADQYQASEPDLSWTDLP